MTGPLAATGGGGSTALTGLLVVVLLGIVTVLLVRNMSGRLRRLPERFPDQQAAEQQPQDGPDGPAGG